MKTYFFSILIAFIGITSIQAQTAFEAIRYSQNTIGGTARVMGVGGAFGAIGADFGGASINPAGIGLYRRGELSISPVLNTVSNSSRYQNNFTTEEGSQFALNNFGLVMNLRRPPKTEPQGMVTSSFVLGVNRLNSYTDNRYISGFNPNNSLIDRFVQNAQGSNPNDLNDFGYDLYDAGIITATQSGNGEFLYQNDISGDLQQIESNVVTGGMNEFVLGFGSNFKDKLYFGAVLGIAYGEYASRTQYTEEDGDNVYPTFNRLTIDETLNVNAYGFNGKLGIIYRLGNALRLGGAFHTPSLLRMDDTYSEEMTVTGTDLNYLTPTYENYFNYRLRTPSKAVLSAAFFVAKRGFISVDYEYINYSKARYQTTLNNDLESIEFFNTLNGEIASTFKGVSNLRIGAEFAPKIFRLRAGYAFDGNPQANTNAQTGRHTLTAGVGVKGKRASLDIAYNTSNNSYTYNLYDLPSGNSVASIDNRRNNIVCTFALRFR